MSKSYSSSLDTHSSLAPSSGSWMALLSVAIGAFALVTSEFLPVGVLNDVARDLSVSTGTAGLMITLPGITAALAAPLISVLVKTLDRRYLLIILTIIMIIGNAITAFSDSFGQLLFGRLILGASIGGFWATAIALSGRLAPAHLPIAKATAFVMAGVTLATVLGVPIGTWLSQQYGWRTAFGISAIVGAAVVLLQFIYLPKLKPSSSILFSDLPALLRHPIARKGLLIILLIGFGHFAAYSYLAPFFKYQAGFDGSQISSLLLIYGAAGIVGNIFAGYAGNLNVRYTLAFVALSLAVTFASFPLLAIHFGGAILLTALWGFAFGAFPTSANIWMFLHAPQAVEKGMPLFVGFFQVMIASGALLGGILVDHFGSNALLFSMLIFVGLALIVLFTLARGLSNPVQQVKC